MDYDELDDVIIRGTGVRAGFLEGGTLGWRELVKKYGIMGAKQYRDKHPLKRKPKPKRKSGSKTAKKKVTKKVKKPRKARQTGRSLKDLPGKYGRITKSRLYRLGLIKSMDASKKTVDAARKKLKAMIDKNSGLKSSGYFYNDRMEKSKSCKTKHLTKGKSKYMKNLDNICIEIKTK